MLAQIEPIFQTPELSSIPSSTFRCECRKGRFPRFLPDGSKNRQSCKAPGKHAKDIGWRKPYLPNNTRAMGWTIDPDVITAWASRWPNMNFGIATGNPLTVVDVDSDGGLAYIESLEAIHGEL